MDRKLSAILAADVAGYSRIMGLDEEGTLRRLTRLRRDIFDPSIQRHRGKIIKTTGDGLLAEFASAVDAVRCAIEVQNETHLRNNLETEARRIAFRIGINVGDIIEQEGDVFGEGVNIAARLENLADPGGIIVSARVEEDVAGKIDIGFEDLGQKTLKNIARPVHIFRLRINSAAPTAKAPSEEKPSIAVLPFQNMSGNPDQDFFSDGISEDIITALSKLHGFFVIARNSSFSFKGQAKNIREIASELDVRYVLEGSVRRSGDRLRVTGQLIDALSGSHIWAERYDRPVADIFAVQDEITSSVVAAIEPQLFAAENIRLRTKPTENLDAWGCVVRAMPTIWTWVSHDTETGFRLLKRALELDPNYARAQSLLAWMYSTRVVLGGIDYEQGIADGLALARRAIDLDPGDPWAHFAAACVYVHSRRTQSAIEEFNEALERNPSFTFAHIMLGATYGYSGDSQEGLSQIAIANRLSPRDYTQSASLSVEGLCYFIEERYADAITAERRAVQMRPDFGTAWRTMTAAAGLVGETEMARQALGECKRLQPGISLAWVEKYHPITRAEDRSRYIEGLRKAGLE